MDSRAPAPERSPGRYRNRACLRAAIENSSTEAKDASSDRSEGRNEEQNADEPEDPSDGTIDPNHQTKIREPKHKKVFITVTPKGTKRSFFPKRIHFDLARPDPASASLSEGASRSMSQLRPVSGAGRTSKGTGREKAGEGGELGLRVRRSKPSDKPQSPC